MMEIKDIKEMANLFVDKNNLDIIIHLIVDNAKLNYTDDDLRITNEDTILQFIKYLYPDTYNNKLEELKKNI